MRSSPSPSAGPTPASHFTHDYWIAIVAGVIASHATTVLLGDHAPLRVCSHATTVPLGDHAPPRVRSHEGWFRDSSLPPGSLSSSSSSSPSLSLSSPSFSSPSLSLLSPWMTRVGVAIRLRHLDRSSRTRVMRTPHYQRTPRGSAAGGRDRRRGRRGRGGTSVHAHVLLGRLDRGCEVVARRVPAPRWLGGEGGQDGRVGLAHGFDHRHHHPPPSPLGGGRALRHHSPTPYPMRPYEVDACHRVPLRPRRLACLSLSSRSGPRLRSTCRS